MKDEGGRCVHSDIKAERGKKKTAKKPQVDRTAAHPPQFPDCRASHAAWKVRVRHVVFF